MSLLDRDEFEDWKRTHMMSCKFMRDSKKVQVVEALEILTIATDLLFLAKNDGEVIIAMQKITEARSKVWGP